MMLSVEVVTLGGRVYTAPELFAGTVENLKVLVAAAWGIPPCEQKMFLNLQELSDSFMFRPAVRVRVTLLRRDPEQAWWLAEVQRASDILRQPMLVPSWVFRDREIMLAAVKEMPSVLMYCNEVLLADHTFVFDMVGANSMALSYFPRALRVDQELVAHAIRNSYAYEGLHCAPLRYRSNAHVVMLAVRRDATALEIATPGTRKRCSVQLACEAKSGIDKDVRWCMWAGIEQAARACKRRRHM